METKILGSKVSINRRYLFLFGLASGISSLYLSAIGIIEELRLIWEFFFRSTCQTGWISSIDVITFDIPLSLTRRQPIVSTANETNVFCYYFYLAGSVRWCDNCVQIVRLNWDMATITRDNCPCGLCIILNLYIYCKFHLRSICPRINARMQSCTSCEAMTCSIRIREN